MEIIDATFGDGVVRVVKTGPDSVSVTVATAGNVILELQHRVSELEGGPGLLRWFPASAFISPAAGQPDHDFLVVERETGKIRVWTASPGYALPPYYVGWAEVPELPSWLSSQVGTS